jgi:hypothetical protein
VRNWQTSVSAPFHGSRVAGGEHQHSCDELCATFRKVITAQPLLFASPHRKMTVPTHTGGAVKTCSGLTKQKAG